MTRLKNIMFISIISIFTNCSSPYKYSKEMKKLDRKYGSEYLKINTKVLKSIKNKLKETNHIFYKIDPIYTYNNFDGWNVFIFDECNNGIYNITYDNQLKSCTLNDTIYDYDLKYNNFVYNLFKNESCDSLKYFSKKNTSNIEFEKIYEINLKTKESRICIYEEILYFIQLYEKDGL